MRRDWSDDEIKWLTENYSYAGLKKSCEVLGRSESQVLKKAHRLNLERQGGNRKPRIWWRRVESNHL